MPRRTAIHFIPHLSHAKLISRSVDYDHRFELRNALCPWVPLRDAELKLAAQVNWVRDGDLKLHVASVTHSEARKGLHLEAERSWSCFNLEGGCCSLPYKLI